MKSSRFAVRRRAGGGDGGIGERPKVLPGLGEDGALEGCHGQADEGVGVVM